MRHGLFVRPTVRDFLADSKKIAGPLAAIRTGSVRIATADILTSQFKPPLASDVPKVLPILLKLAHDDLSTARTPSEVLMAAFVSYQCLLTLHPLVDGNGRVSRLRYAADLHRSGLVSPIPLITLHLMLRNGGGRYHAAAWSARASDYQMLLELFLEHLQLASQVTQRVAAFEGDDYTKQLWRLLKFG